jgi:hypothetical protein
VPISPKIGVYLKKQCYELIFAQLSNVLRKYFAEKMAFFLKTNAMIQFFAQLSSVLVKMTIFFGENIS